MSTRLILACLLGFLCFVAVPSVWATKCWVDVDGKVIKFTSDDGVPPPGGIEVPIKPEGKDQILSGLQIWDFENQEWLPKQDPPKVVRRKADLASAEAKLRALGLTGDEIDALMGN